MTGIGQSWAMKHHTSQHHNHWEDFFLKQNIINQTLSLNISHFYSIRQICCEREVNVNILKLRIQKQFALIVNVNSLNVNVAIFTQFMEFLETTEL